jgi:hypothetical protein
VRWSAGNYCFSQPKIRSGARASTRRAIVASHGTRGDKAWGATPAPGARISLNSGSLYNGRYVLSLGLQLRAIGQGPPFGSIAAMIAA